MPSLPFPSRQHPCFCFSFALPWKSKTACLPERCLSSRRNEKLKRKWGSGSKHSSGHFKNHELCCLRSPFLRLSLWIIKMLSHIKKYNAVYGRTINTASKLITFPLWRIIYFAALRPQRSHSPLLLSHWLMSELCKIESPISLNLMSLNFEKKKRKREKQRERAGRRERRGRKRLRKWEHCTVLGKIIQYKSGSRCLWAHTKCLC